MLDEIIKLAAEMLDLDAREVAQARTALLKEEAAGGRLAASTSLINAEGASTPLPEAASRAQASYANFRKKMLKELPAMIALMVATKVAEERRDEAKEHLEAKYDRDAERLDTGVHAETQRFFSRMYKHGVHPNNLKQFKETEVAIFADLARWKAHDPRHLDPQSPWRAILSLYAARLVEKPGNAGYNSRSVPGHAEAPRRRGVATHYMFNEIAEPGKVVSMSEAEERSIQPVEAADAPLAEAVPDNAAAPPRTIFDQVYADRMKASAPLSAEQEFALPAHLSASELDRLRVAAKHWFREDPDWNFALMHAAEHFDGSLTDSEIITAVERIQHQRVATPLRYFVEAARERGIEAGREAYYEATLCRFMLLVFERTG